MAADRELPYHWTDTSGCIWHHDTLSIQDVVERLDVCTADIAELQRNQEIMMRQRKDDVELEEFREQLESLSDRLFSTEERQKQAEERQDEAIAKANMTFQKHAYDVESERQNLRAVTDQVNQNFQYLSSELEGYGMQLAPLERNMEELQDKVTTESCDMQSLNMALASLGSTVAAVDDRVRQQPQDATGDMAAVDRMVQEQQQQQINALMASTRATEDAVQRMVAQGSSREADARYQSLRGELAAMEAKVCETQALCQDIAAQLQGVQEARNARDREIPGGAAAPGAARNQEVISHHGEHSYVRVPRTAWLESAHEAPPELTTLPAHQVDEFQAADSGGRITEFAQHGPAQPPGARHWTTYGPPPPLAGGANKIGGASPRVGWGSGDTAAESAAGSYPGSSKDVRCLQQGGDWERAGGGFAGVSSNDATGACHWSPEAPAVPSKWLSAAAQSSHGVASSQEKPPAAGRWGAPPEQSAGAAPPEPSAVPFSAFSAFSACGQHQPRKGSR